MVSFRTRYSLIVSLVVAGLFVVQAAPGQAVDHWETVVYDEDAWRYLVPVAEPDAAWRTTAFDDAGWSSGAGGFGYGDDDDRTVVAPGVASVYQRITFSVSDTSTIAYAVLHVDYDDAYVAYLNGVEVARRNVGSPGVPPPFDRYSDTDHEAVLYQGGTPEGVGLPKSVLAGTLRPGDNVLAVQTHNVGATSSDLTSRVFFSVGLTVPTVHYGAPPTWFAPPATTPGTWASTLPLVVVDTQGREIPDEPKVTARMGIVDNGPGALNTATDPFNAYDGFIGIERRGSSSQSFPKLSYAVETHDADGQDIDVALLGLPEEEDWVLHGPYSDKSLMRNVLVFHLANRMGRYASRTRYVELILNGDYRGVYVLMEKIKRDKNRVDISKLNPDETTGDDLTGGYIVKIDKQAGGEVDGWYSPYPPLPGLSTRVYYQYDEPSPSEIVPAQEAYIRGVIATFEDVMAGSQMADPENGYARYIDVDSAVDFYLLNELARNVDGYRLSTFLYKDKDSVDGRLVFGPVWDFNLGFGNADYYDGGSPVGFQVEEGVPGSDGFQPPFWWETLWRDSTFNGRVQQRWTALRAGPLHADSLVQFIDATAATLGDAVARNFERWPVLGTYVWPNRFVGGTYPAEIDYLKSWLRERLGWMDEHLPQVVTTSTAGQPVTAFRLSSPYPNPFRDQARLTLSVGRSQRVRVDVYDPLGRRVAVVFDGRVDPEAPQALTLSGAGLAAGVYLVRALGETGRTTRHVAVVR